MSTEQDSISAEPTSDLAQQVATDEPSLVAEFVAFLANNKKWWLAPIIAIFLLVSLLVVLGGSGAAPFIYTLF